MSKINENSTLELPLNDERKPETKKPRHVVIAINHLTERRKNLLAKRSTIDEELAGLDAAILALE